MCFLKLAYKKKKNNICNSILPFVLKFKIKSEGVFSWLLKIFDFGICLQKAKLFEIESLAEPPCPQYDIRLVIDSLTTTSRGLEGLSGIKTRFAILKMRLFLY